jgi:hypothetical protein
MVTWSAMGAAACNRLGAPRAATWESCDANVRFPALPGWRNGRRGGLKSRCPQGRAGSTPAPGIQVRLEAPRVLWGGRRTEGSHRAARRGPSQLEHIRLDL